MSAGITPVGPGQAGRPPGSSKVNTSTTPFELAPGTKVPVEKTVPTGIPPKAIPTPPLPATPSIARQLKREDLITVLLSLGRSPTPQSIALITALIEHGLEASQQNATLVESIVNQKRQPNALESAVISVSKGLGESLKSVDLITQFITNKNQFNQLSHGFDSLVSSLRLALNLNQGVLPPDLMSGLLGVLSELDDEMKRYRTVGKDLPSRAALLDDLQSTSGFLAGVRSMLSKASPTVLDAFGGVQQGVKGLLEAVVGHAVMSEYDSQRPIDGPYYYVQIPHPMGTQYPPIEWLIQQEHQKEARFNPDKTKMILSFETPELGGITIVMDIQDRQVSMAIHSNSPDVRRDAMMWVADLRHQLKAHDYELIGVKTSAKRVDINALLMPKINLDRLSRIDTEV
ncbi:hypothetical protein EBZ35_04440 [bacterium]|nr:hypothetical protein [bacterium]